MISQTLNASIQYGEKNTWKEKEQKPMMQWKRPKNWKEIGHINRYIFQYWNKVNSHSYTVPGSQP